MKDFNLLGACGLYCGACTHYRASFPESKHLLNEAKELGSSIDGFECSGCRSGKEHLHTGCDVCNIRTCVETKGLTHCCECETFPCDMLTAFQNDGRPHHLDVVSNSEEVRKSGFEQWLIDQKDRWKCKCGLSYSWYEGTCANCSSELNTYKRK